MSKVIATIVYVCINCKNEIRRPVHEDEMIMLGKTKCMKCGNWIIYFKVEDK